MMLAVCALALIYASCHAFDTGQISMVSFNLVLKAARLMILGGQRWMCGR
jgi:hypothetical protein